MTAPAKRPRGRPRTTGRAAASSVRTSPDGATLDGTAIVVRLTRDERAAIDAAAMRDARPVSTWARLALLRAAKG